jgi:DNA polymerase-3 subunit delta'
MGFSEFLGNERIVTALRRMLKSQHVPSALLFTGPRGGGKFTLARMFAQATNCQRQDGDFCGACPDCLRVARLADLQTLIEQGLTERGPSPDAATVERTPLLLQPHPDVCVAVPDPVRLRNPVARPMIRLGQLRAIQRAAYFHPEFRRRIFILDGADTMRSTDADAFLKILEEPPDTATLILLALRPDSLLPTIRSRCLQFHFAPVPLPQVEALLAARGLFTPANRALAAQLSEGSPGAALAINLEDSVRLRSETLAILRQAADSRDPDVLFASSAKLAKNEKESFENVLELFYSLLTDLLAISHGPKSSPLRNPDLRRELEALHSCASYPWVARATVSLDQFAGRLHRNVNRELGLEAWALSVAAQ